MRDPDPIPSELDGVKTLVDMLAFRAQQTPTQEACIFEGDAITFEELWGEVNQVASFLLARGIKQGDRVMLIFPNGLEFFSAFYGVMRAGAIAAPIFPNSGPERVLWIVRHSGARFVFVPSFTPDDVLEMYRSAASMLGIEVCRFDDLLKFNPAQPPTYPTIEPEALAFFQYTSGSTGDPKAVQLSHRNLIANVRQMIARGPITRDWVFVSWLPVYHDLGLILMTMCPMFLGAKLVLLPTSLRQMQKWLQAMTEHRATVTAAPDLGYRLALKQIPDANGYDLSSLIYAINAAEPVRLQTVQDFEARFGVQNVVKPAYGLAEASVGVSTWGAKDGAVRVAENGFISVGKPFNDVEILIMDEAGKPLPTGEVGEIAFRSPSATRGYYKNPDATHALLYENGFLRSGDIGFLDAEGYLYIVSRRKNMLKQGGRSFAPIEIEELVDSLPEVRYSAAIGVDRGDEVGEQIYVFAEAKIPPEAASTLVRAIVKTIHDRLGVRPGRVYITNSKAIPFTYNGKIQHTQLKQDYLSGALSKDALILYPNY